MSISAAPSCDRQQPTSTTIIAISPKPPFSFFAISEMNSGTKILIAAVCIILILVLLIEGSRFARPASTINYSDPGFTAAPSGTSINNAAAAGIDPSKESFILTSQTAHVSPITGAIKGPGIMTDGMTRMDINDIAKRVNSNGFVSDGAISLGVGVGNGFDGAYNAHLDIQAIDNKAVQGYQTVSDLDTISRKINTNSNVAVNNLFTRAGSKPTKLSIAPNEIRAVIDEKYLPERDKNHKIVTVGTVVPVQGYDVNVERLGEHLLDTHFSKISRNKAAKRMPTAAGANLVDGSNVSPNKAALDESVSIQGGNLGIKDSVTGQVTLAPIDGNAVEGFRSRYVKGSVRL